MADSLREKRIESVPRVLVPPGSRWHDRLRAVAYYGETELERWIKQHVKSLFPHYHVFPFKRAVQSKTTATRKPDLGMIRHDLLGWGIIEVELVEHSLSHVLEQARAFLSGDYNSYEVAEYVRKQLTEHCGKTVSLKRLRKLFLQAPKVLVIVDEHDAEWQKELGRIGVDLCVFEIYKNVEGRYVYRALGEFPVVEDEAAHCRPHKTLSNLLEVLGPFTFKGLSAGSEIDVSFDGYLTRWAIMEDDGRCYLGFLGVSNPLSPNTTYALLRDKSDRYHLTRN